MMSFSTSDDLLKNWCVLVVDDEADSLEVAQTLLEMCGATILTAKNGQEGLEKAIQHRPRFILSDLSMPEMNGWQLLHALKNDVRTQDIPVIALTAHAMQGDRELGRAAGFHNYLTKPLVPETFINTVLTLLLGVPSLAADLASRKSGE